MKQTYITTMPDHVGAFLEASRRFASLGLNITRVSYNKAVDTHTLFIEAEGTAPQHEAAARQLAEIGYLQSSRGDGEILLAEFTLRDIPGAVTAVLELIGSFDLNISYISSQENGTGYQYFKMGLLVEDRGKVNEFLEKAGRLCEVRVIDYRQTEKYFDNSIFYSSYSRSLADMMKLGDAERKDLLVNVNLAMQRLDEHDLSPFRTFDAISGFAGMLAKYRGDSYNPRITDYPVGSESKLTVIEPPCGSNTFVFESRGEKLFIDSGYACYKHELDSLLARLVPEWKGMRKRILITHPDVDHCGSLGLFDEILMSKKSYNSLLAERESGGGYRENNPKHAPYIRICKLLTGYLPPDKSAMRVFCGDDAPVTEPLLHIGELDFGEFHFEVYEGQGGHIAGEILLVEFSVRICFTGDIYVNIADMTPEQSEYNKYAPVLMTSVDTDPVIAAGERKALLRLLTTGKWQIFGSHGRPKTITVP